MSADVRKIINSDPEAPGQRPKRGAHELVVLTKRPIPVCPLAREDDVHGAPRADGPLALAPPPPDGTTVLGSDQLSVKFGSKEGPLHTKMIANKNGGAMLFAYFRRSDFCVSAPTTTL